MGIVSRTNGPGLKEIQDIVNDNNAALRVGFFPSAFYPDANETSIAYVASIQEFGVPEKSIPARPFMRPTIDNRQNTWSDTFQTGMQSGLGLTKTLETLGVQASTDVQDTIREIYTPELSKITLLARKWKKEGGKVTGKTIGMFARQLKENPDIDVSGVSTKPLNDTGAMYAHVQSAVGLEQDDE